MYKQTDFMWGALLGGAVATLATLLFTTEKGKKLVNKMGEMYDGVGEKIKETFVDAKEKVEEAAETVSKKISDSKEESADDAGKKHPHKHKAELHPKNF